MDAANLRSLESATRYGPPAINLLLIVLIGIALARLIWLLVPVPTGTWTQPPELQQATRHHTKTSGPDIAAIQGSHLFGVADKKHNQGQNGSSAPINAPETHLNLTLDGILAWNHPALSRVLIRGPNGKEHHYAIGDEIPGNAKIDSVYPDRVILKRAGGYETLRLKIKKAQLGQSANSQSGGSNLDTAVSNQNYGAVRTQLLRHPNKITQVMRLQPSYENGKLTGYRVYPGAKRGLFKHLGLRPGDLITSINGTTLNSQRNGLRVLGELKNARQLDVTLKRNGSTRHITLSLQ